MRLKLFLIFQLILIIVATIGGQIGRSKMSKCGIQDINTIDELYNSNIMLGSVLTDEHSSSFTEYKEDYINDVKNASIVAIIKPTGNIKTYYHVLAQEVIIEKIILGNVTLENKTIYIYEEEGFALNKLFSNNLAYHNIKNIMQINHEYLGFFNPLELNPYSSKDSYRFVDSFFNYLDLTHNTSNIIKEPLENVRFKDVKELEFFTSSVKTSSGMMAIKESIIDTYIK